MTASGTGAMGRRGSGSGWVRDMCYILMLSTTFDGDLTAHDTDLLGFVREPLEEPSAVHLMYPNRWLVRGHGGTCSCGFRHVMDAAIGFGEPEDWHPEEPDSLEATRQFYAVVRTLAASGFGVDCVDAWNGADASSIRRKRVTASKVGDTEFRLFENYHFEFHSEPRAKRRYKPR